MSDGVNHAHPLAAHPEIINSDDAIIRVEPRRKRVAICGFATSTREMAPFDDPEFEIWGLNQLYRHIPRADRWFDIHENWNEHVVEGTDHAGWIKNAPIPVYMKDRVASLGRSSVRFPIERVLANVGLDYFTSTVAFMVALAMEEKFETIALYGIDLIVGIEYQDQKPCTEFLLGVAHGRGIEVRIPVGSALLRQTHRYGYQLGPAQFPLTMAELAARKTELTAEREKHLRMLHTFDGALQDVDYWLALMELRLRGGNVAAK